MTDTEARKVLAALEERLALLRQLDSQIEFLEPRCPFCGGRESPDEPHTSDCRLAAALKDA